MKKKLSLPILLLAVVVMLSIFYIKEADKTSDPVVGPSLEQTTTNADYAEARLQSIAEVNALILECELNKVVELLESGKLSLEEVEQQNSIIASLKQTKIDEIALEEMIMAALNYDDVLVLLDGDYLLIDIYTEEEMSVATFIKVSRLAKEKFSSDLTVKLSTTNSLS